MKKSIDRPSEDKPSEMRAEYMASVVIVDPEMVDLFPNAEAVNAALRSLSGASRRARTQRPV